MTLIFLHGMFLVEAHGLRSKDVHGESRKAISARG
jgi:hypothetical protein